MRACGDNPLNPVSLKTLHVSFNEFCKEACLSHPSDFTSTALFFVSQNAEIDSSTLEAKNQCLCDLLNSRIKGRGTPDEVEIFSTIPLGEIFDLDIFG